jgi:hypothetical protein
MSALKTTFPRLAESVLEGLKCSPYGTVSNVANWTLITL